MNDATVRKEASRLMKLPKVAKRLTEMRIATAEHHQVTLQSHLADLLWLREMAARDGKYGAAVAAEMARGKVIGLYVERIAMTAEVEVTEKVDFSTLTTDDLRALHAMLAKAGQTIQTLQ
jgi:hypothetical protein